jgi:hypothetical protein
MRVERSCQVSSSSRNWYTCGGVLFVEKSEELLRRGAGGGGELSLRKSTWSFTCADIQQIAHSDCLHAAHL